MLILDKEVDLSGLGQLTVVEMKRNLMNAFAMVLGPAPIVLIQSVPVLYAVSCIDLCVCSCVIVIVMVYTQLYVLSGVYLGTKFWGS